MFAWRICCSAPILPALADELRTHLQDGRKDSFSRAIGTPDIHPGWSNPIVKDCALQAGIAKRVYPHLLRHRVATILLDSVQVPIDQVQKFLGHLNLSTTQIYAETSLHAPGDNYLRALGGNNRTRQHA